MADSLAGLVLAAGAGTRLAPLTRLRPKALCPLGDRPLLDHALDQLEGSVSSLAVNAHHGADRIAEHLAVTAPQRRQQVHLAHERPSALGTAGAVGALRAWLAGKDLVVLNADTWVPGVRGTAVSALLDAWDRERPVVLTTGKAAFGPASQVVASALPWKVARELEARPSGLWEVVWRQRVGSDALQVIHTDHVAIDCGTPTRYLDANLLWLRSSDGGSEPARSWIGPGAVVAPAARDSIGLSGSVVGARAEVEGTLRACVVWPGSVVHRGESLVRAIRADDLTVLVR